MGREFKSRKLCSLVFETELILIPLGFSNIKKCLIYENCRRSVYANYFNFLLVEETRIVLYYVRNYFIVFSLDLSSKAYPTK